MFMKFLMKRIMLNWLTNVEEKKILLSMMVCISP
jgi:hypothetical protein